MAALPVRSYEEAIRFLYGLQHLGVKLGLTKVRRFLHDLDDPQDTFPSIHIAGSNGKGSTAAFLSSILMEAGFRTALFTSPHLVDFRERIRVGGKTISARFMTAWLSRHARRIRSRGLTFFEVTAALAFDWFRSRSVDIAVIETGLGGRLDATNVIEPLVSVITSITKEHTRILGADVRSIAREKAGIGKPGIPCCVGDVSGRALAALRSSARERYVPLVCDDDVRVTPRVEGRGRTLMNIRTPRGTVRDVASGFPGSHQAWNVVASIRALSVLKNSFGFHVTDGHIRRGIGRVVRNSGLQARCSPVPGHPGMYADVAHNPDAMEKTAEYFLRRFGRRSMNIIFGISSDKDFAGVLSRLKPLAKRIWVVAAKNPRSRDPGTILRVCRNRSIPAQRSESVRQTTSEVLKETGRLPALITGSHFVVGEALAFLQRRKYLTITQ